MTPTDFILCDHASQIGRKANILGIGCRQSFQNFKDFEENACCVKLRSSVENADAGITGMLLDLPY